MPAKIWFVGAGPGDPDLITVKGRRLLEAAGYDVVIIYRSSEKDARSLERDIATLGRRARALQVDITDKRAVADAFTPAQRRVSLTGTPFRTKADERIPFVRYEESDDGLLSAADYSYGYGEALADGIVRPVLFMAYSGDLRVNSVDEGVYPCGPADALHTCAMP